MPAISTASQRFASLARARYIARKAARPIAYGLSSIDYCQGSPQTERMVQATAAKVRMSRYFRCHRPPRCQPRVVAQAPFMPIMSAATESPLVWHARRRNGTPGRRVRTGWPAHAPHEAIFQHSTTPMPEHHDIDHILRDWPYDPGEISVRLVQARDGREVLQMRIEMGVLQLEVDHRPDGQRPGGAETYFDYLIGESLHQGKEFVLSEEQCVEADREFVQFYHRRICWLALREYRRAVTDADHNLAFMDFVKSYSPAEEWTLSHEQYRPFILFHRTQAEALARLEETGPEEAIEAINAGLARMRGFYEEFASEEHFEEDDMVARLTELRESLRDQYGVGQTLSERLQEAIAREQYELAAELRDQIARRSGRRV